MIAGIVTAVLLVLFVVGWAWAWSPRRKTGFDAAAQMPLEDEFPAPSPEKKSNLEQSP